MSKHNKTNVDIIVVLVIILLILQYWPIALVAGIVYLAYKVYKQLRRFNPPIAKPNYDPYCSPTMQPYTTGEKARYSSKNAFMTDCEKRYFAVFSEILGNKYIIQPQINLASVVNKDTYSKYRNELFRNIDFGIFNKNYQLLLLIEINDKTHSQQHRQERDRSVNDICNEAGIPLVTFWTKFGIDKFYIKNMLEMYLHDSFSSSMDNEL